MKYNKELYRDPVKGRIAGVCAGIAEYFGIETWLVRIIAVSGFFLAAGPFFFVAYVAAWFILEKKPAGGNKSNPEISGKGHSGKGWQNTFEQSDSKVEVKSRVWQAGEPPRQAFYDIKRQFRHVEDRLRKVETYVTSKEYQLNRELSQL